MKLLITGASGFLGKRLFHLLGESYQVFGLDIISENPAIEKIDITDHQKLKKYFLKIKPNIIIHTAAISSVEECEQNPQIAWKVNYEATKNIADVASQIQARYIFTSSLNVYEGKNGNYSENSETKPINIYGKTKLKAEKAVLQKSKENIVLRLGTLYGYNGSPTGSPWQELQNIKTKKEIVGFKDTFRNFTWIDDFPKSLIKLTKSSDGGVYNFAGYETHSDYEYINILSKVFKFNKNLIHPQKSPVHVTKRATLDCSKLKALDIKMTNLKLGLEATKNQIIN
jgi:dTDP-4-dehydrorhamnose reductase